MKYDRRIDLEEIPLLTDENGNPLPEDIPLINRIDWKKFREVQKRWEKEYDEWVRQLRRSRR